MKKTLYTILLCTCLSISYYAFTNSGAAPAGYTGAPGDFGTCGNVGCHGSTPITSGTSWNNFNITSNVPANGYTPGAAYTITVSHSVAGVNKWGFEAVALNSSNAQAGSITAGTGQTTGIVAGKTYITHNSSGNTGTGSRSWSFTWTAPNPGVGDVTIYAAVNAADGNSSANSGDQIFTKSLVIGQFTNFPTAVIDGLPANGFACLGDTLFLSGSGINSPTDFAWTFTGLSSSTAQNPAVVFTTTGTKTITLVTTNSFGSSATNIKTVNVVNKPTASLLPAGSTLQKCGNDSVTLSTTASSLFSFLWSPGNQTTPTIRVKDTGDYSARVTNPNTGCFVQTAPIKILQLPTPVSTLSTSADTICSNDSVTLTASGAFTNYRFFDGATVLQSSALPTYKNRFVPGVKQLGLVVTGANSCRSDTIRKQLVVVAPLPAPVLTCGPKTTSSVTFTWLPVTNAVGYEVSTDTGKIWMAYPADTLSYTFQGLSPNVNKQIWVRARSIGFCNEGETGTLICTNGSCSPITYSVSFEGKQCLQSPNDSVMVPVTVSALNVNSFGISIANNPYSTDLTQLVAVKVGGNPVALRIVDSNNIGCPRIDTNLVLFGLNPILEAPELVTVGPLCTGDSAVHTLAVLHANKGASYFDIFSSGNSTAIVRLNANGDSVKLYTVSATVSPIQNGTQLFTLATDTVTGCVKQSDTLTADVVNAPPAGFTSSVNGLEAIFTDTTSSSVSRSWYYNGIIADDIDAPNSVTKTFPSGGTYPVMMVAKAASGCLGYAENEVVVFNTGLPSDNNTIAVSIFPNPANTNVSIECILGNNSDLRMNVFDIRGELIQSLYKGQVKANNPHWVTMDVTPLHDGIYFVKIQTNEGVKIVKLTIAH